MNTNIVMMFTEAYRMDIDPKENASSRQAKKAEAVAIVDAIKTRLPKA